MAPEDIPGVEAVPADVLEDICRTVEQAMTVLCAAMVLWQILPESFKERVRAQIRLVVADVERMRAAHRDRLKLRSEAWHVGQIVRDYDAGRDRARFIRSLCVADMEGRPPGLGQTETE
jgi:hypothetical protein